MKKDQGKIKSEHTILSDFLPFLQKIEKLPDIQRIIPGRIKRQQKGSSLLRFSISYPTITGLKANMSKGATSQEIFIICERGKEQETTENITNVWKEFI